MRAAPDRRRSVLAFLPAFLLPAALAIRGDADGDGDGGIEISDPILFLGRLFLGEPPLSCDDATMVR